MKVSDVLSERCRRTYEEDVERDAVRRVRRCVSSESHYFWFSVGE